jgi:hypothetical protein
VASILPLRESKPFKEACAAPLVPGGCATNDGKIIYNEAWLGYESEPTFRRMKIAPATIERQAACRRSAGPDRRVRVVGLGVGLLAVLASAWSASCGPLVSEAPFRARADSLQPADLLGPFTGQVLDSETDKPVEKAIVYASWAFERGMGFVAPRGAAEVALETDANGRYRIDKLAELPGGLSMRVARFTLIVYQRGYVAYRSDSIFPEQVARRDFVQRGNVVRLTPWSAELSHARHMIFVGGGAPVRRASAWELEQAALELDRAAAQPAPVRRPRVALLNAAPLLTADEVRATTGFKGLFDERRLLDLARTAFYDSRHFQAVGQPQTFDVAYRVWRLDADAAEERYLKLLGDMPAAKSRNEIADRSLRAREGDILAVAFLDRGTGAVVEMTCGTAQCKSHEVLIELARRTLPRLARLTTESPAPEAAPPAPGPKATPKPSAPPPEPEPPEESPEPSAGPEEPGFRLRPPDSLKLPTGKTR